MKTLTELTNSLNQAEIKINNLLNTVISINSELTAIKQAILSENTTSNVLTLLEENKAYKGRLLQIIGELVQPDNFVLPPNQIS